MSYFSSAPDYLTNPSFGFDSADAYSSTGSALAANPLAKPSTMAFPFEAIATLGSSIFGGIASQKAAETAAAGTEAAAREAAAATRAAATKGAKVQISSKFLDIGGQLLGARYSRGEGAFANRWQAIQDQKQQALFSAQNPYQQNLRAIERFDLANQYEQQLRAAMPGYQPPMSLFG